MSNNKVAADRRGRTRRRRRRRGSGACASYEDSEDDDEDSEDDNEDWAGALAAADQEVGPPVLQPPTAGAGFDSTAQVEAGSWEINATALTMPQHYQIPFVPQLEYGYGVGYGVGVSIWSWSGYDANMMRMYAGLGATQLGAPRNRSGAAQQGSKATSATHYNRLRG